MKDRRDFIDHFYFYLCFIDQETDSEKGSDVPKLIEVVKCIAEF